MFWIAFLACAEPITEVQLTGQRDAFEKRIAPLTFCSTPEAFTSMASVIPARLKWLRPI